MPLDTTGWFQVRFLDQRLSLRIPPAFVRDETVAFVEGGWRWRDGSRQFDIASDPNPGILSPRQFKGASFCRDTVDGVPLIVETARLTRRQTDGRTSLSYLVSACCTVPTGFGYYDVIRGISPDSADQRLFLSMIRTLRQTGYPSGEKRKWFGRQPIRVRVHAYPVKGGVRYEYRIFNGSRAPIVEFKVGFDQDMRRASIRRLPGGWEARKAAEAACRSPLGWAVTFVMVDDGAGFFEWKAMDPNRVIAAGRSLSDFSILTDRADDTYRWCLWTATTSSGADEPWFSGGAIPDPVR